MKNLTQQLNTFKNITPSSEWRKSNRNILMSQIYGSEHSKNVVSDFSWGKYFRTKLPADVLKMLTQPTMVVILICLFIVTSGLVSARVSMDTKPGDSLYIAKIISEKTQLAFTFGEKEKAKLRIGFAGNRVKEMDQILINKEQDDESRENVQKLITNFKKEIVAAKTGLEKINLSHDEVVNNENVETPEDVEEEDVMVFSANSKKEKTGITTSEKPEGVIVENKETLSVPTTTEEVLATTTMNEIVEMNASSTVDIVNSPKTILMQAGEMLEADNVMETLNLLTEANNTLGDATMGQVKGVEDAASTTIDID